MQVHMYLKRLTSVFTVINICKFIKYLIAIPRNKIKYSQFTKKESSTGKV